MVAQLYNFFLSDTFSNGDRRRRVLWGSASAAVTLAASFAVNAYCDASENVTYFSNSVAIKWSVYGMIYCPLRKLLGVIVVG